MKLSIVLALVTCSPIFAGGNLWKGNAPLVTVDGNPGGYWYTVTDSVANPPGTSVILPTGFEEPDFGKQGEIVKKVSLGEGVARPWAAFGFGWTTPPSGFDISHHHSISLTYESEVALNLALKEPNTGNGSNSYIFILEPTTDGPVVVDIPFSDWQADNSAKRPLDLSNQATLNIRVMGPSGTAGEIRIYQVGFDGTCTLPDGLPES